MNSDVEEVRKKLSKAKVDDDATTNITVCSWNILGEAKVEYRKKVTTETFKVTFSNSTGSTTLGGADIICLQEMNFDPEGKVAKEYLPFISQDSHKVCSVTEAGSTQKRNAIFYREEKFKLIGAQASVIEDAFKLMDTKRQIYDDISSGGDDKIKKAVGGKLTTADFPKCENKRMCKEVLEECKEAKTTVEFHQRRDRYKAPGEDATKSPGALLRGRMAICCLEVAKHKIVVISLHNYSKPSNAPLNYIHLLFDFLNKVDVPVLIAGDFNYDITPYPHKGRFQIQSYELKPLRKRARIDFIVSDLCLKDTAAHDLQVPSAIKKEVTEESKITNHNPLSAVVVVK